jgi:hypothetical protein
MVRRAIEAQPLTRFDRSHLLTIGETGLRVENVYYVLDADYNKYADIQHAIHVELLRRFQQEKIEFAVAARTIYFKSSDGPRGAGELRQ